MVERALLLPKVFRRSNAGAALSGSGVNNSELHPFGTNDTMESPESCDLETGNVLSRTTPTVIGTRICLNDPHGYPLVTQCEYCDRIPPFICAVPFNPILNYQNSETRIRILL